MANTLLSATHHEYVSIDTAPGASGEWSNPVIVKKSKDVKALFFSRSGGGVAVVSLQYLLPHDGAVWTDYVTSENLSDGCRFRLDELGTGVQWRAGIKLGDFTSNTVIVGFDW